MLPIRVKELLEPIFIHKKKPAGFCSFLKAFSWETDLWVTVDDFKLNTQSWEDESVFNQKSIKKKRNFLRIR